MQHPNYVVSKKNGNRSKSARMARAGAEITEKGQSRAAIIRRCETVCQMVAGGNQTRFAAMLGISVTRWNNIQSSGALSLQVAQMMVDKFDLSLDWLYRGNQSALSVRVARDLEAAEKALTSATAGRA